MCLAALRRGDAEGCEAHPLTVVLHVADRPAVDLRQFYGLHLCSNGGHVGSVDVSHVAGEHADAREVMLSVGQHLVVVVPSSRILILRQTRAATRVNLGASGEVQHHGAFDGDVVRLHVLHGFAEAGGILLIRAVEAPDHVLNPLVGLVGVLSLEGCGSEGRVHLRLRRVLRRRVARHHPKGWT